eukprot:CAMPEP_0179891920 /NCGR_PEP_ID=MMETSP0982-20121206/33940_1 /TAXON_ID=483367 /ORGANISM="non described non described, Strain CCMP 2436" /LENGTH=68 /DNA_ID=CAMNT_0021788337 /DNA_START=106 /DNA_END=309 /DNA_ORIENTATION=+
MAAGFNMAAGFTLGRRSGFRMAAGFSLGRRGGLALTPLLTARPVRRPTAPRAVAVAEDGHAAPAAQPQ